MSRVGPILLSNPIAREQFLTEGEVVTFRAGEQRTTGETHARWERTGKGMADCRVDALTAIHPGEEPERMAEYAESSGFRTADRWLDAIRESSGHGTEGEIPSGYLYQVTFQRAREPLTDYYREEYGMGHCDGCGERVAPHVLGHGGKSGGEQKNLNPAGVVWCAWCEISDTEDRPDGWRFHLPENTPDLRADGGFGEVCDHCGRHIAVAGHAPDCPESDDELETDGGDEGVPLDDALRKAGVPDDELEHTRERVQDALGDEQRLPITLRGFATVDSVEVCDGADGHDCVRDSPLLLRGEDTIHVTEFGPGADRSGRRVLCGDCNDKQTALSIAEHPDLARMYRDELPELRRRFPDILAGVELDDEVNG